ncbi:RagB/SusD family nutrient uptake outer membrane protein [Reichenbachiella sp. MALMAid0571]|uniref:RagB/SusD family nutrient uptake outer membrane protein n=1 Tax=Reichenbachiella sp. MALMAid0571 TaxID=3143939 RepID=UPI0032DF24B7
MMKKQYNILMLLGLLFAGSCELNEEPYGFYSEGNFLTTPEEAEAAITYAYDALTFLEYSRTVFYLGDLPSETLQPKEDQGGGAQELNFWKTETFSNNANLNNFFKYAYIAINRANLLIEKVPQASFDEDDQNKYLGEAYFLRAWNYFNLVRNFGLVPLQKGLVSSIEETSSPRASNLDEVYDLILGDVRKAAELLTINQATGRADKVAAQALAAKAYLYIASAKEHNVLLYDAVSRDVTTMYDSAEYYSGLVINGQSTYGLEPNLLDIYDVDKAKGSEHIFIMSMDRTGLIEGDYSKISKLFIPYVNGGTIYLDESADASSRSHDGWNSMITVNDFYDTYETGDKRAEQLFVSSIYDENQNLIAEFPDYPMTSHFCRKYIDPNFIGDKTSTKPFLIRYSEVALIYAEAAGPTAQGYAQINAIRDRAGLEDLEAGLSVEDFRMKVFEERAFELAYEGNRMYDLRRFKMVKAIVPNAANISDEDAAYYPLPQIEVDLNQNL